MKNRIILGLDVGIASIGHAVVKESNGLFEVLTTGVRIIHYDNLSVVDRKTGATSGSRNAIQEFSAGKGLSASAARTASRGARRTNARFKQRRDQLKRLLKNQGWLVGNVPLEEFHGIWRLRSKAASERVELGDLARILLAINKKRGYKSNRKANAGDEGAIVDSMDIAIRLYENQLTPGQWSLEALKNGRKKLPDFYQSDLKAELMRVWESQKQFYPEIFTDELYDAIQDKNSGQTWKILEEPFQIEGIRLKNDNKRIVQYQARVDALSKKLDLEYVAIALQEINAQIGRSSGYLGAMSDRSKVLYFRKQTVGQFFYEKLNENPHYRVKKKVFYRQDYLDEFERIWEQQAKFHSELTPQLKGQIRDEMIFFQRPLKSQKGLVSVCELEGQTKKIVFNGKERIKTIGPRVCPKSSPLFQQFKIWQKVNDLAFHNIYTKEAYKIAELECGDELRIHIFQRLNVGQKITNKEILKKANLAGEGWTVNFKEDLGVNTTNAKVFGAFEKIIEHAGRKTKYNKNDPEAYINTLTSNLEEIGIRTDILTLHVDEVEGRIERSPAYEFWHLLYSYSGDDSKSGTMSLKHNLEDKYGVPMDLCDELVALNFKDDYGNLSAKAIRKMLPYMASGLNYYEASKAAGYRHSKHSKTREEREQEILLKRLPQIDANTLRNPVVTKILNQMVNVVNALIDEYGEIDEIRVELARDLKKSAKERQEITSAISKSAKVNADVKSEIQKLLPFRANPSIRITRKDIIKYRLYEELKPAGYKDLYTNQYIPKDELFTGKVDIEHIIPRAKSFNDSFSNKTLAFHGFNSFKDNRTAMDAMIAMYGEESPELQQYKVRLADMLANSQISKSKYKNMLMTESEIPSEFANRDIGDSGYIAKYARQLLEKVARTVVATSGQITARLRADWQLIDVLRELAIPVYQKLGLTEVEYTKDDKEIIKIKDWSKRSDHRHHAMDAITVAFTSRKIIQYFNYLNAHDNFEIAANTTMESFREEFTHIPLKNGKRSGARRINPPLLTGMEGRDMKDQLRNLRSVFKNEMESMFISFKPIKPVVRNSYVYHKAENGIVKYAQRTPRGQLHQETVYGKRLRYVLKDQPVGSKMLLEIAESVTKPIYRSALINRLRENSYDAKKAFTGKNSLKKNPILCADGSYVPLKVKTQWLEEYYVIRKAISPNLVVDKVIDQKTKSLLKKRLSEHGGDPKKAFVGLDENPIWQNRKKGIAIKTVTLKAVNNAVPLRHKRDRMGDYILDDHGNKVPADFVVTGNTHHIGIYRDSEGLLHDRVVSFLDAVHLAMNGMPVVDKSYNQDLGWQFVFSMSINDLFVFPNAETGFAPKEVDLLDTKFKKDIARNLYRVQYLSKTLSGKSSIRDYGFRYQFDSTTTKLAALKGSSFLRLQSLPLLNNIVKVDIDKIGRITNIHD